MTDQTTLPDITRPQQFDEEQCLHQSAGGIRGCRRVLVSAIVHIGKKLAEVKETLGHGKYGQFIRERLGSTVTIGIFDPDETASEIASILRDAFGTNIVDYRGTEHFQPAPVRIGAQLHYASLPL
jgi:hypothetical protein